MPGTAELIDAVHRLGAFAAEITLDELDARTREATDLLVLDTVGVAIAGARTPELGELAAALDPPPGPARLLGTDRDAAVESAALVNGTAAGALELDEGNKHARGHPSAHVLPAVLALGAALEADGRTVLTAFLAGHEVAARFGRATRLTADVHPHGHWGATGAAAGCARLLALDAGGVSAAIDAAAGLALAPPFESALAGSFVRNTWTGVAAAHGVLAARLAAAGLAAVDGTAGFSLGGILGRLDPGELTDALGERFDVRLGYLKRHAACSFTHPAVDAVLELRRREPSLDHSRVRSVRVGTYGAAARLDRTQPATRLAAMFSIPHMVAAALVHSEPGADPHRPTLWIGTAASGDDARADPDVRRLAAATTVEHVTEFDGRAPRERPARVTLTLDDGSERSLEVPNPVGDADHHPLDRDAVQSKLRALLGTPDADLLETELARLRDAPSVRTVLAGLPGKEA